METITRRRIIGGLILFGVTVVIVLLSLGSIELHNDVIRHRPPVYETFGRIASADGDVICLATAKGQLCAADHRPHFHTDLPVGTWVTAYYTTKKGFIEVDDSTP